MLGMRVLRETVNTELDRAGWEHSHPVFLCRRQSRKTAQSLSFSAGQTMSPAIFINVRLPADLP